MLTSLRANETERKITKNSKSIIAGGDKNE